MPFTEAEQDAIFLYYSNINKDEYYQWKQQTQNGTLPATAELNFRMLVSALKRDRHRHPNFVPNLEAYSAWLTTEKKAEIEAMFPPPAPATTN